MHLSEEERGELAARLLASLGTAEDDAAGPAWSAEIQQRIQELDHGNVRPIPWQEARSLIAQDGDEPPVP